jgi:hypothetical protein
VDKSIGVNPEFIAFMVGKGSELARSPKFKVGIDCKGEGAEFIALNKGGRGGRQGAEGSFIVTTGNASIIMLLVFMKSFR